MTDHTHDQDRWFPLTGTHMLVVEKCRLLIAEFKREQAKAGR